MNSVLITGGSGSFGTAFVERLLYEGVKRICIYSRGEHRQAEMRRAFDNHSALRFFIGDVRDRARLETAMQGCDVVVHAAALKRVETGVYNPEEMSRTNVDGAINVIHAARAALVRKVVLPNAISGRPMIWLGHGLPVSVMGTSGGLQARLFLVGRKSLKREGELCRLLIRIALGFSCGWPKRSSWLYGRWRP